MAINIYEKYFKCIIPLGGDKFIVLCFYPLKYMLFLVLLKALIQLQYSIYFYKNTHFTWINQNQDHSPHYILEINKKLTATQTGPFIQKVPCQDKL